MRKTQFYKITIFWVCCLGFMAFYEGAVTDYEPSTPDVIPFSNTLL